MALAMVALEREHVVGVGFLDFACDLFLAAHRIKGDDFLRDTRAQGLRPGHEHVEKGLRLERGQHAVEGVVGGNARAQAQEGLEPAGLGVADVFHVVEAFAAAEQTAQGDDEHVDQFVVAAAAHARAGQLLKLLDQTQTMMRLHPDSSKHTVQKYKAKMSPPQKL